MLSISYNYYAVGTK